MPRPRKSRKVCDMPKNNRFGVLGGSACGEEIYMSVDEYETIRLLDLLGYTQEECAVQMGVARTTIQGVYNEARRKMAETLVNGKTLVIAGGTYSLCQGAARPCGNKCHMLCCKRQSINETTTKSNKF